MLKTHDGLPHHWPDRAFRANVSRGAGPVSLINDRFWREHHRGLEGAGAINLPQQNQFSLVSIVDRYRMNAVCRIAGRENSLTRRNLIAKTNNAVPGTDQEKESRSNVRPLASGVSATGMRGSDYESIPN
jgi:hypothetical protein